MTLLESRRLGRFRVYSVDDRHLSVKTLELLEAAQRDCVVLECTAHAYDGSYEIVALHPRFEIVNPGEVVHEYTCQFRQVIGGLLLATFERSP